MLTATAKVNQAITKRHNARLVLKNIYDQGPVSRAEIARTTNLTATTVSSVIGELLADGLVEEVGSLATERGKPPTLVALKQDARSVIGLNLAQAVFRGGVLNLRGEVLYECSIPAEGLYGDAALAAVFQMVEELLPQARSPLLGIGIGAPGIIETESALIRRAVNLQWYDLPLPLLLAERYQSPIYMVNDNQASLLAEHLLGHYKQSPNLVVIRIGRGIGAGIMVNGQLLDQYAAGEIGHVTVVEGGERCSCGNYGCLETVASSRAIVNRVRALLPDQPTSHLYHLARTRGLDIATVIQAYHAGDQFLWPIVDEVGRALGIALAYLVGVLGMPPILLCGSVTGFGRPLLERIEQEIKQRTLLGQLCPPHIDLASQQRDIIMVGATTPLLRNELGLF